MSERNDGGPAYPSEYIKHKSGDVGNNVPIIEHSSGMTLRDWFAGKAMQGFYAGMDTKKAAVGKWDLDCDAQLFYKIADAMLEAREHKEE